MRLFEHEAKAYFREAGLPVPEGSVCRSGAEAETAARALGGPVVVKAQILSGGRGKAGGIRFADAPADARREAEDLLGKELLGHRVGAVLVETKVAGGREVYLGVTIDRRANRVVLLLSSKGGMSVEEAAAEDPNAVQRVPVAPGEKLLPHQALAAAKRAGITGAALRDLAGAAAALHELFVRSDAKLVEVNPLLVFEDGKVLCADGRMNLDDDAVFRHPELAERGIGPRHEEGELTPREAKARELGIPYLDLEGDIGMFPGGAGFGILGNDFIHHFGGRPANFMDSGGGPTPERLAKMLALLEENPNVVAIFGARFGGISRCDDFAKGMIAFLRQKGLSKPMALRMTGNMWEEGLRLFEEAKRESPELFRRIEMHGIETPIEDVCRRAVEMAEAARARQEA